MYFVTDEELEDEVRELMRAYGYTDEDLNGAVSDEVDLYSTLTLAECEQALDDLDNQRLAIDDTVRSSGLKGEEAAEEAKRIRADLNKVEGKLNGRIRSIEKEKSSHLAEIGADDYALDDDGNVAVTAKMDEVVDWWEQKQAELRTELELKMQETVGELRTAGIDANHIVRDRMYETLVAEEVIEQWEPLEF